MLLVEVSAVVAVVTVVVAVGVGDGVVEVAAPATISIVLLCTENNRHVVAWGVFLPWGRAWHHYHEGSRELRRGEGGVPVLVGVLVLVLAF